MQEAFFNFRKTEKNISYQPYLYDGRDNTMYFILGFLALMVGFGFSTFDTLQKLSPYGYILGVIFIIGGIYRVLVKQKSTLIFSKEENKIYKKTVLSNQKLLAFDDVYAIELMSEDGEYAYCISSKKKASKTNLISSFFSEKRVTDKRFQYFENIILLQLFDFLNLENKLSKISTIGTIL